jgi:hypothetical protein
VGFSGLYQSIYSLFFHTISRQESAIDKSRPLVKEAVSGIERPLAVAMIVLPRFRWWSGQQQAEKTLLKIDVRAHNTYGAASIRTVLKGRFFVDSKHANDLANRISKGENSGLYETLVKMCIPYLLDVKEWFGFHDVSAKEVYSQLAADAVNNSIAEMKLRKLPFTARLQNDFRDLCRKKRYSMRKPIAEKLAEKCGLPTRPRILGADSRRPSPDIEAQRNEEVVMLQRELGNHGKASKTAICERMRGSPYAEIAQILDKKPQQCRALFWHDVHKIRDSIRDYLADDEC